jgi:hypothetical protein
MRQAARGDLLGDRLAHDVGGTHRHGRRVDNLPSPLMDEVLARLSPLFN